MQAKSKTYGMRCTPVHMTPLGSVNVADYIAAVGTKASEGGLPIQYIHYALYGEQIANQQTIGYAERYKFTGKERDAETGYDYFDARYYDQRKGFWNSVAPLVDKYPGNTPYLYRNGNPILLVDPDGRDWYDADGEIKWTDCKSQEAMNKAGIKETYHGCAVLDFQGSRYETLGWGNKRPENKAGKDGVYIHSCSASGYAGPTYYDGMKPGSGISVGCLLLLPKDFRILNAKMDKSRINSFYVRVSR